MNTNAARVIASVPNIQKGEALVVALTLGGETFQSGGTYTKAAAHSQATRLMNAHDTYLAFVVYRHAAGTTVYASRDTVLGTEWDAA